MTATGEQVGQAATAAGQGQPEGPAVNNLEAKTSASHQQGPAAQPGAGNIVVAQTSSAQGRYHPGTLACLSQEWDETNRAGPAVVAQGPMTTDGQVAAALAGEPNLEQMFRLFARA